MHFSEGSSIMTDANFKAQLNSRPELLFEVMHATVKHLESI